MSEDCKDSHEVNKVSLRCRRAGRNFYKNTPEVYECSQFFSENSHKSQWEARCRKGAGGSGESEVFEGSLGFRKAVRGSGGQQGIQEEG